MNTSTLIGRGLVITTAAVGCLAAAAGTAGADPAGLPVTIACDNGVTYAAVIFSSGAWSPALDSTGTSVLVPLSFGTATYTVRDSSGNIILSGSTPAYAKSAHPRVPTTTSCTFDLTQTVTDPDLGQLTAEASGPVVGFVTPA